MQKVMSVGKLNVNLPDPSRAADDYAELQTAAAAISPQAVDEVKRIIATHYELPDGHWAWEYGVYADWVLGSDDVLRPVE